MGHGLEGFITGMVGDVSDDDVCFGNEGRL